MANKKLGTAASELRLPTKKDKSAKKPKWQAKIGKKVKVEPMAEMAEVVEPVVPVDEAPVIPTEFTVTPDVATTPDTKVVEPNTTGDEATTTDPAPIVTELPSIETPATTDEHTVMKPRKLKVQADLKPKKLSMIKAALQVLQVRKVPMTSPEMIDVMATEDLWTSPGGKTPAATLYAAISRSIKELGKASVFRKAERGKFEAKILALE